MDVGRGNRWRQGMGGWFIRYNTIDPRDFKGVKGVERRGRGSVERKSSGGD